MTRALLSVFVCACALVAGLLTAFIAARNRARGTDLDRRQHWCETFARQNDLQRAIIEREEWLLIHGDELRPDESADPNLNHAFDN